MHSHGVDMQQEEQRSCAAVRRLGMFNQMDDAGEYFHRVKRRGEKWSEGTSLTPVPELRFPRRKRAAGPTMKNV